jgi:hypothetical protein
MGALAPILMLFLTVLILGFGFNGWTLAAIIMMLTVSLSLLMTSVDIEKTKANWEEERCELGVVLLGFLYKPYDDPKSSSEFSSENFNFCIGKTFEDIFKTFLSPLTIVIGKTLDSTNVLNEVMNGLRFLQARMMLSFKKLLDPFWRRFMLTGLYFSRVFQRLYSSMLRAGGIAVATLYIAMGIQITLENFVKFFIKVVIILIFIIAALFILLFFILAPTLPLILTVMAALIAGGLGAALGSVGDTFCFAPETRIKMYTGDYVEIRSIQPGDLLADKSIVEGVLEVDATDEQMYSVDGIHVSGAHIIWSPETESWMNVKEYPNKIPAPSQKRVFCLRTTTRSLHIQGVSGKQWKFRDWEELPSEIENVDKLWDTIVNTILNHDHEYYPSTITPNEYPLIGSQCRVWLRDQYDRNHYIQIHEVKIGDEIYGEGGFTKVLGVYTGLNEWIHPETISGGCWVRLNNIHKWNHLKPQELSQDKESKSSGYHLITESGNFCVMAKNYSGFVRDFTEVGIDQLPLTYPFVAMLLEKSLAKEE